jgi:hypothetical protein
VLVAAATVAAVGYAATAVITGGSGGEADSGAAGSSDAGGESGAVQEEAPESADRGPVPIDDLGIEGLDELTPDDLRSDLRSLAEKDANDGYAGRRLRRVCGPQPAVPGSRRVAAAYDDRPALVVYLPAVDGEQRVDVYLCDADDPRSVFRSVTLTP